jgi:hypothetical protein
VEEDIKMSYQKRLLGQQLGAFVFRDPPLVIANHDLAEASGTFWNSTLVDSSITTFDVSGPAGSIPGTYTAGGSGPPYIAWNSGGDDLTKRGDGKWQFEDDGDVVWVSVDTDKLYPWNVQVWEDGPDAGLNNGTSPVFTIQIQTNSVSGMTIFWDPPAFGTQTIFWGDATSETFEKGDSLSHTWTSYTLNLTSKFTTGQMTETSNSYMSGNYMRGSSKLYEKLI